jgi:pimeloyl-ACP methyl ester carboxylesterase
MRLEVISETAAEAAAKDAPPLLFVHGAWHAAWCWRDMLKFFAERGYVAHAMSLRGHGASEKKKSLRLTTIGDYVDDIAEVVRTLPRTPVIVAHSMGSFVMHHYLRKHEAAGVAFVAPVPPRAGAWGATWNAARRHPIAFARVNLQMSLYPMIATPERAADLLFSDEGVAKKYHPQLQDESYPAYVGMLTQLCFRRPAARIPAFVVGGTADALISEADMRATAKFYGCEAQMFEGVAHDMMLEPRGRDVAEAIERWLRQIS